MRRPVVGVFGSSTSADTERARPLGSWLATIGVHLLTGGGTGTMEAVSRAFAETPGRMGLVLGVLPGLSSPERKRPSPPAGYPNAFVELAIRTHLPALGAHGAEALSRNHVNVLSSDVVVALAGQAGTASEVELALRYEKPVVAYVRDRGEIAGLPIAVRVEPDFSEVRAFVCAHLPASPAEASSLPLFRYRTFVAASPESVYDLVATGEGWSRWFTKSATFDARPGGRYRFEWQDFGGDRTTLRLEGPVLEAERPRGLVFDWESGGEQTRVRIRLEPRGHGTLVTVTEEGYGTSASAVANALLCAGGWGEALTLLKFYAEHGIRYGSVPPG